MPDLQTRHPDMEKLAAFGHGAISEVDSKEIEQHLADCVECREKLENVPPDSLVSLLQASASETLANLDLSGPSADTDSSTPSKESLPPFYKKLAQIIGGKPVATATPTPPPIVAVKPGFIAPRELEGHARYLVLEPLGAGGMGTVYKAQHRLMERIVALKIVNPLLVNKPGAVERFTREVKAAAQLVHPNIVTAFDAEKVGDMHVLVMEYVEGQSLADVLNERRELPIDKACEYVRQTANGLQHAFERGMVHRDIKPQNLMLTSKGEIKILDVGLARFVSEQAHADGSTEHGALMGSPDYMAPEQGQDAHSADTRADIYSMGCTLYHLIAGQVPFPTSSLLKKLEAHRDEMPLRLDHVRAGVPAELAKVVEKMLAKDPDQRYQTPAEVAEALRPFTHVQPELPDRARDAARSAPFLRKPKFALAIAALLLVIGVSYWLAQFILRVETPNGTLIIKTDDPDVQISVKSGGKEVVVFFPKDKKEVPLKVGEYTIELVGGKDGLRLSSNNFKIESGVNSTVTVEFVPAVAKKELPKTGGLPDVKKSVANSPAIPTVEELIKSREVLTVAQDGSARFKTINEALDAVRRNQVILVKDKGPYRELLNKNLPPDVALVSLVGTRIEIPKLTSFREADEKGKFFYYGAWFNVEENFRLSGFEWVATAPRPDNLFSGPFVALAPAGNMIVERCLFRGPQYLTALTCFSNTNKSAELLVQENFFTQVLEFHEVAGSMTVQRNWVSSSNVGIIFNQRDGNVTVRQNIINASRGLSFNLVLDDKNNPMPGMDLKVVNNILEVLQQPVVFLSPAKGATVLPRSTRIANNIIRSKANDGVLLLPDDMESVKARWVVGPNAYQVEPRKAEPYISWPLGASDQILTKHFLSVEPNEPDYLRIAGDSPLAKNGAGGELPDYFGAFSPGPAPKQGDWFTQLSARVAKEQSISPVSPKPIAEALPLNEYLNGRVILTVARDGKAMFTTINAAIDKLKPNQVIKVLDKGPYRETLSRDLPENVGLVSEVGTRIEIPEWTKSGEFDPTKFSYAGWVLKSPRDLRLSGFEIVEPKLKANAGLSVPLSLTADGDITLESMRVLHTPRYSMTPPKDDDPAYLPIRIDIASWTDGVGRLSIQDNYLECALFLMKSGAAIAIQRNHIVGWRVDGIHVWAAHKPREVVVRENFIQGQLGLRFDGGNTPPDHWADVPVSITNNVFDAVAHPLSFFAADDAKKGWYSRKVNIHNNIFRSQEHRGIVLTVRGLSEVQDSWKVSHNCYQNEPGGIGGLAVFPKQVTDVIEAAPFLSFKPSDADFLRIDATGPLAASGVGGERPKYMGLLSPGAAPKSGDWFTQLQAAVRSAAPPPALLSAPIEELLKTREVVTVAQDGSGHHKTIQAALDNAKVGQVILVKGKRPYRETPRADNLPSNIALVSLDGARIEVQNYIQVDKSWHSAAWITSQSSFRMSGLTWIGAPLPKGVKDPGVILNVNGNTEILIEKCRFENPFDDPIYGLHCNHDGETSKIVLLENYFDSQFMASHHRGSFTIERNWFARPNSGWHINLYFGGSITIRHNIFQNDWGFSFNSAHDGSKPTPGVDLRVHNNVFDVAESAGLFNFGLAGLPVVRSVSVRNNLVRSRKSYGFCATAELIDKVKDRWKIGPNVFATEPKGGPWGDAHPSLPKGPKDLVVSKHFLSDDPLNENYLRVAAEGDLATKGAGGDLPAYFGAFAPGPSPKDGDWFTRMQPFAKRSTFQWPVDALREGRITLPELSKAKTLYKDEFDDPKSGWPIGRYESGAFHCTRGYENGKFFIHHPVGGASGWGPGMARNANFVCQVDGRVLESASAFWGIFVGNDEQKTGVRVRINGQKKIEIAVTDHINYDKTPLLFSGTHSAIKAGQEFNTLTVLLRSWRLEVYVNGVAICDPLRLGNGLEHANVSFELTGEKARAELERITVWSADGIPTPEERLTKGEVPVVLFAWPSNPLREGRITAPDLSKIKPRFDSDFSDAKTGWPAVKSAPDKDGFSVEIGYDKGKYAYTFPTTAGSWGIVAPWGKASNFAFQLVGRLASPTAEHWGFTLANEKDSRRIAQFHIHSTGKFAVTFGGEGWFRSKPFPALSHPAIKRPDLFNTMLVIVRDRIVEVYINGIAICDPIVLEQGIAPCDIIIGGGGNKGARLEFERVSLYSAEGVPTPAERLAKGDVPVTMAPPPLDEWRKGRTFITVAQDGKADHRTVQEALNAVKTGQYVKILDKGPYRETLVHTRAVEDIGLISDVGTRIEVPKWHEWGISPTDKTKRVYQGGVICSPNGLRLLGLDFALPPLPNDADFVVAIELVVTGDATIESCRVRYHLDVMADLIANDEHFRRFRGLCVGWFGTYGTNKGRFELRDNRIDGIVDLHGDGPVQATVQRNWIRAWGANCLELPAHPETEAVVRHNIIQGTNGIVVRARGPAKLGAYLGRYLIANNAIDVQNSPFWAFPVVNFPEKDRPDRQNLSKAFTFQNNVVRSQSQAGVELDDDDLKALATLWKVDHNCFGAEPKRKPTDWNVFSKQPTDLIVTAPFVSIDSTKVDFMRIATDSRLTKAGAGGSLPDYIGALPPGPAPKEGDWLTRLLDTQRTIAIKVDAKELATQIELLLKQIGPGRALNLSSEAVRFAISK